MTVNSEQKAVRSANRKVIIALVAVVVALFIGSFFMLKS